MNFKIKIFIVTLVILIFTLVLNSVLSIFSFEKIYTQSLISTYEMAGISLKRKIEQSLFYGKPLKNFQGMDTLLAALSEQNRHLSHIWIETLDGTTLYEMRINTEGTHKRHPQAQIPEDTKHTTFLIHGEYVTAIPLMKRSKRAGTLCFSFPQSIIYVKLQEMAVSNINTLWLFMINSAFCLIFLMAFFIFRPFKKEIKELTKILCGNTEDNLLAVDTKNAPEPVDNTAGGFALKGIGNEIDVLTLHLNTFVSLKNTSLTKISEIHAAQESIFHLAEEINLCIDTFAREAQTNPDLLDFQQAQTLQKIINNSRLIQETIQLVQDFARTLESSITPQTLLSGSHPDTP